MTHVDRWNRGRSILGLAVEDMERTRALRTDLEVLPGVRPEDPAREIIWRHARGLSDELASLRTLREELRSAAQREQADMDGMVSRCQP
jgi:hypothetical protein